jgi:signal transduction histidine kinase
MDCMTLMKFIPFVISLIFTFQLSAQNQDGDIQSKIDLFNSKIQQTEKGARLQWMDSLTRTVWDKTAFKYDSIAKKTINYAIHLDSLAYASRQLCDLIYYHNNVVGQPKEGVLLFDFYYGKLKNLKDDYALGSLNLYVGDSYMYSNNLDKAIDYYKIAVAFGKSSKNEELVALANLYLGFVQSDKGLFSEASVSLKNASQIYVKQKDTLNILSSKNALAILYSRNAFYDEAKTERDEAIAIGEKINDSDDLASLYYNAAEDYKRTGDGIQQIAYLKASLKENSGSEQGSRFKPVLLATLTNAYVENDSLALAETSFKELEAIYKKDESSDNRRQYVDAKKTLSFAYGDYNDALKYGESYLEIQKEGKKYEEIMMAEKFLSKVYKAINEDANSNMHLVNYYAIKDSVSSVQNVKSLAYYQTLYETEKRDLKIGNQKASIGLLNLQNKNKTQLLIFGSLGLLVLFGAIMFYRSFLGAKKRELAQQHFSQELIKTQEQERTRIAKDLHDGVGQQITLLKLKAQNTNQTELSDLAHTALEEVRSISRDLYPVTLAKLGLTDSIEQLLLELDEETDLFVSVEIDDINTNFDETESLNFYRFIQESVNNVLKHANAKTLIVNILKQSDGVKILIKDNGEGFEVSEKITQNSLGLKTMAERISMLKGSFAIKSKRTEGTSILVQIPI